MTDIPRQVREALAEHDRQASGDHAAVEAMKAPTIDQTLRAAHDAFVRNLPPGSAPVALFVFYAQDDEIKMASAVRNMETEETDAEARSHILGCMEEWTIRKRLEWFPGTEGLQS